MNDNDKKISACIDVILYRYGKSIKINRQIIIKIADEYELPFKNIPELEKKLNILNITIFEDKNSIVNRISKFI